MTAPSGVAEFTTVESAQLDDLVSIHVPLNYDLPEGYIYSKSMDLSDFLDPKLVTAKRKDGNPSQLLPELMVRHEKSGDIVCVIEAKYQHSTQNAIERLMRWIAIAVLSQKNPTLCRPIMFEDLLLVSGGAGFQRRPDGTLGTAPGVVLDTWTNIGCPSIEANSCTNDEVVSKVEAHIKQSIERYESTK